MSHHGSSPLAREIPRRVDRWPVHRRFIPARAGNTTGLSTLRSASPVHPRSRGKYATVVLQADRQRGSSPLAREILPVHAHIPVPRRFIPARAGNTASRTAPPGRAAVHPRSRGKYSTASTTFSRHAGSSPLAREILGNRHVSRGGIRFIPARAGNTW